MSDRTVFVTAVIFVVFAVIVAKIQSNPPPASAACTQVHDTVMIGITKRGFDPQNVPVGHCDRVIFENFDNVVHRPAFGEHAHHGVYPTFIETDLKPQKASSFIAAQVGIFTFHDHLHEELIGTLTVK